MRTTSIGQLCELNYGKSLRKDKRKKGTVPVYGSNGIVDYHDESIVEYETIIVGRKGSIGEVHYVEEPSWPIDTTYYISIKDDHEVHLPWFYRILKSHRLQELNKSAAIPGLNRDDVYRIKILLPLLDDQIRIAHLLGKVEGLIAQRKQHLQQLDDLLKSVFLDMFGPKAPGYPDWPLVEIKDLAANHKGAMRTGPFGSNLLHSEFTSEGDVAVLGIDNAVQNRFAWGERRFITYKKYQELESYRIYSGDVIVTIMGTIGRSAVIPGNIPLAINTKHLAAITLNKEIANPLFVSYSIHSSPFILNQFRSRNRGAIMSGLNLGIIKETKLKQPPVVLQNKFAAIHERIDEVKSRYQQSLTDLEYLYGALSQKAFKGELDLSRVPLLNIQNLPTDDELEPGIIDLPQPKDDKLDSVNEADADETDFFNTWTFHEYLRTLKDEVLTSKDLWEELQRKNFKNPLPSFNRFKIWILTCLEQGEWMEQVYGEVSVDKNSNVKEKKIALRIRDDS